MPNTELKTLKMPEISVFRKALTPTLSSEASRISVSKTRFGHIPSAALSLSRKIAAKPQTRRKLSVSVYWLSAFPEALQKTEKSVSVTAILPLNSSERKLNASLSSQVTNRSPLPKALSVSQEALIRSEKNLSALSLTVSEKTPLISSAELTALLTFRLNTISSPIPLKSLKKPLTATEKKQKYVATAQTT